MDILQAILGAQGGGAAQHLGEQFGLDQSQVSAALGALVPALAAGFQNNMSSPQGLDGLTAALAGGRHQQYVEDAASLGSADTIADGNGILGHVFGSKDVSRQVASRAAAQTGIGQDVLKQMLPVVAAMMMGTMSKRMSEPHAASAGAGFGGTAAGLGGAGGLLGMLTPMLDSNRDGSIVDDVAGLIGRMSQR